MWWCSFGVLATASLHVWFSGSLARIRRRRASRRSIWANCLIYSFCLCACIELLASGARAQSAKQGSVLGVCIECLLILALLTGSVENESVVQIYVLFRYSRPENGTCKFEDWTTLGAAYRPASASHLMQVYGLNAWTHKLLLPSAGVIGELESRAWVPGSISRHILLLNERNSLPIWTVASSRSLSVWSVCRRSFAKPCIPRR